MTQGACMNAGPVAFRLGLRGMPAEAESSLVERDIRLVTELRDARAHLHVAHTSTAAAIAAVRQARRNGLRVTCEVAPHHFLLTDEHVGFYNTQRQDESAAALGRRPRRHDRGHPRRRGRRDRHRSRAACHAREGSGVRARAQRHHRPRNRAGPLPALAASRSGRCRWAAC